ncbi:MAG: lipase [Prevotella sp.]|nr:lipase [Prevotella sp.]
MMTVVGCLMTTIAAIASTTIPLKGTVIKASDPRIVYTGRISFANPEAPTFSYPGTQIMACFEGTSLKVMAKPMSGYFMAQIDQAEPFKVGFMAPNDSVVTVATALADGRHLVKLMYVVEGLDLKPVFKGFILDEGRQLAPPPALPQRKIEFIGNSITCGYGNESIERSDPFEYETENHYYTYAAITARNIHAQHWVVARSGIGIYRNYNGPRTGNPDNMPAMYEYTLFNDKREQWDFSRYQPDVVCINLGTNDLSTPNFDIKLFTEAYRKFLKTVREHYPNAKIVLLTGSMLNGKEMELQQKTLNELRDEARKNGDKEVYRFDFTPQTGELYYGASWHPSIWQHEKMAGELTAFIRMLMKWW